MKKAALFLFLATSAAHAQIPAFPLTQTGLVISRPTQPQQPFTVAGPRGVLVGTQDGQFESWILPVKLLSHLTIEANVEGYSVPIEVNPQSANIEVRPDRTTLTYSHIAFTLRQIMFSPDSSSSSNTPATGPIVLFQIDSPHPVDLTFRFTPEMRWMWPKRNDGIPSADWVKSEAFSSESKEMRVPQVPNLGPGSDASGYYVLHMDYPDLAGAITIPTATPGILAPYQERPQVHPLELHLHYDPKIDGTGDNAKFFPLLMAVGTTKETATNAALGQQLQKLNAEIPEAYKVHAAYYAKLQQETTTIETPDKALNEAFNWGVVSIEQLKAHEFASNQDALVAGYFSSGDSARPGFGWFFGRDALYTLYAVNSFGDFALTRSELEFLAARQRPDGKIMHEFSQTASDPAVHWQDFPYMYAAADATPLFLMAMRDYYRASGDLAFVQKNRDVIERAWAFETAPTSDSDHDGIYDNSQGTGWVESWPHDKMPHQEVYLALLDEQASLAYSSIEDALSKLPRDPATNPRAQAIAQAEPAHRAELAYDRAEAIKTTIEKEYYDPQKGCYAFSHNQPGDLNGETDRSTTVYPAIAWWDDESPSMRETPSGSDWRMRRAVEAYKQNGVGLLSETNQPLAHAAECLSQFASPTLATDWGLRDVATTEPFYDGMSYHQGSVWPLFTGWAALAEYRGNQPLAGEQMLMQNVDLTWAQDPGAVTELLSGDFYVPFGRSTSHQLWSSAMVITPTLRGLFGINLDAATNTITVNPHLPADWNYGEISHLHIGNQSVTLAFDIATGVLKVREVWGNPPRPSQPAIHLRSDLAGAHLESAVDQPATLTIPLPPIEVEPLAHKLPAPGARPSYVRILSTKYGPRCMTLVVGGQSGTRATIYLRENQSLPNLELDRAQPDKNPGSGLQRQTKVKQGELPEKPTILGISFPKGQGWQTLEFTLTW